MGRIQERPDQKGRPPRPGPSGTHGTARELKQNRKDLSSPSRKERTADGIMEMVIIILNQSSENPRKASRREKPQPPGMTGLMALEEIQREGPARPQASLRERSRSSFLAFFFLLPQ